MLKDFKSIELEIPIRRDLLSNISESGEGSIPARSAPPPRRATQPRKIILEKLPPDTNTNFPASMTYDTRIFQATH